MREKKDVYGAIQKKNTKISVQKSSRLRFFQKNGKTAKRARACARERTLGSLKPLESLKRFLQQQKTEKTVEEHLSCFFMLHFYETFQHF